MIILGSRGKENQLSEGQFFCPKCSHIRHYKQKRISNYFTLYFIPLFETKNLGEFVQCQVCKGGFDPKILDPGPQRILQLVAGTRKALLHGISPGKARTKLIKLGVSDISAAKIIALAQC